MVAEIILRIVVTTIPRARIIMVLRNHPGAYVLGHLMWVPAETGASYGDLDVGT